jgi:pimeloyl-ACP methyl ester carboxylesterase
VTSRAPHADLLSAIPVTEHEVSILGSRTRYWTYGAPDAARTVVVIHGYRGEHHGLEPVVVRLIGADPAGVRVIAPDLPGFGESTELTSASHSISGYGRWLHEFLDRLELLGVAILLGHSFGSIVVAHAAAAGLPAPAVILVNPIASDPGAVTGIGATRFFYGVGRRLPEGAARAWLGNPLVVRGMSCVLARTRDRDLRRWIHEQHRAYFSRFASRRSVVEGFDASLSADVGSVAEELPMPVLLVAGERDEIAPLEGQFAMLDRFPDARLVVIPDVGHLIHYETPDAAAHAIGAFLAEVA